MRTISENYVVEQKRLHQNPAYGVASVAAAPLVAAVIAKLGVRTVSDYGAGKQRLYKALVSGGTDVDYFPYDPAYPEYGPPIPAELVTCIDVLEHVEPECLEAVLQELLSLMRGYGFFTIHTGPAIKELSDGRNAHLIQQPASWWLQQLGSRFEVHHLADHNAMGQGFFVIVSPRQEGARPEA